MQVEKYVKKPVEGVQWTGYNLKEIEEFVCYTSIDKGFMEDEIYVSLIDRILQVGDVITRKDNGKGCLKFDKIWAYQLAKGIYQSGGITMSKIVVEFETCMREIPKACIYCNEIYHEKYKYGCHYINFEYGEEIELEEEQVLNSRSVLCNLKETEE